MGLFKRGKVWWISFSVNGRQIRKSTNSRDKKVAERIYHKVMTLIAEGKWFDVREKITFQDLMEKYMKEHSMPNKRSWERDIISLKHLIPFFGSFLLDRITPKLINQYKLQRRKEGASSATINREIALMKHAFSLAVREWEWCSDNPAKKVSMEKEPPPKDRWLTLDEEHRLLELLPAWARDIVVFSLDTGCRMGEALSLTWRNVELGRGVVTIFGQKIGERRSIPLTRRVKEILRRRAKVRSIKSNLVFLNDTGDEVRRDTLRYVFKKACNKAGIDDLRFHDLRHTFATRLAQAGVDPYTVQKLMGHKSPATTQRYAHHYVESLRKGIVVLEEVQNAENKSITILSQ